LFGVQPKINVII